ITTSITGGVGANLLIDLTTFQTITALVNFINTQPGYKAAAGSSVIGTQQSSNLDIVANVGICSSFAGNASLEGPGRIKTDANAFFVSLVNGTSLVQETNTTNEAN